MAELDDLSGTDASNTGRFPENQAPSTLNNGGRALEGMIARWIKDVTPASAATLSGSTIQITVNRTSITLTGTTSNYRTDLLVGFKMGANPNTGPVALNLNSIGRISLRDAFGASLTSSHILSGMRCLAIKDGDNGYFRLLYPPAPSGAISAFGVLDEDDFASDSDTDVPTQQSAKAYVDTQVATKSTLTLGTPQASTSGTAITFSSIPSGTKRITIMLAGVSTSGSSPVIVQLGDSGGVETTGYLGSVSDVGGSTTNETTGLFLESAGNGTHIRHGNVVFNLENSSSNTWVGTGNISRSESTGLHWSNASKSLSGTLDRVVITTEGGSDTFDAGAINILYEQ